MAREMQKRPSESVDPDSDDGSTRAATKRVKLENHSNGQRRSVDHRSPAKRARRDTRSMDVDDQDESEDGSSDEGDPDTDFDDDDANLEALRRVQQMEKTDGKYSGRPSEAGIVKSMELVNFMCHKHWSCDFGAKLNFVVGQNGSGKSAVLTALAIVLGAKAAFTGRGQGVKELIRRGCDKAVIKLTIANDGKMAFRPDRYHPNIIIERTLDKSGASGYKFRATKDGKILDTKREVLTQILNHFALNIESPLTLLTQDAAKTFLASTDEHKLYQFFLRGTSLSLISEQYTAIEKANEAMGAQLVAAKEGLPDLRDQIRRLQRDIESASKAQSLKKDREEATIMYAWALVNQKEQEVDTIRRKLEDGEAKKLDAETKCLEIEGDIDPLSKQIEHLDNEVKEAQSHNSPNRQKLRRLKAGVDLAKRKVQDSEETMGECRGSLEAKQYDLGKIEEKIAAQERDGGPTQDPKVAKLREERNRHQNLLKGMERRLPHVLANADSAEKDIKRKNEELGERQRKRDELFRRLGDARSRLTNLERQASDRLAAYGTRVDLVSTAIRQTQWKHSPPLGPLGQYVQLEDMRYRDAFHSALGQTLCSFAVRDPQDKSKLLDILRNCARQGYVPGYVPAHQRGNRLVLPQIITHAGDRFDFSHGDLSGHAETILSKLKITNEDVVRILVDKHRVERTLVSPSLDESYHLLKRLIDNGVVPAATAITMDKFQQNARGNNFTSGPMDQWHGNALFVADMAAAVHTTQTEVDELKGEHEKAVNSCTEMRPEIRDLENKLAEAKREIDKIRNGMPRFEAKINDLGDQISAIMPASSDALQATKDEYAAEIAHMEQELQEMEGNHKKVLDDHSTLAKEYRDLQAQMNQLQPEIDKKEKDVEDLMVQRASLETSLKHYRAAAARADVGIQSNIAKLEIEEKTLKGWMKQSIDNFGDRVYPTETVAELDARKTAIDWQIARAREENPIDLDDVLIKCNKAKDDLRQKEECIQTFTRLRKASTKALEVRKRRWNDLRSHIAVRARTLFISFVNTRGFEGRLIFHHESERLDIRVMTTNINSASQFYKAPNSLSGGERSFSTVSFLLSLWDTTPSTLHCLDEWDVFLDMVNRRITAKLITDHAQSTSRQYILITPQDMGGIAVPGAHNKIIRMKDPERNQATLD